MLAIHVKNFTLRKAENASQHDLNHCRSDHCFRASGFGNLKYDDPFGGGKA